jgi:hypothetical protein
MLVQDIEIQLVWPPGPVCGAASGSLPAGRDLASFTHRICSFCWGSSSYAAILRLLILSMKKAGVWNVTCLRPVEGLWFAEEALKMTGAIGQDKAAERWSGWSLRRSAAGAFDNGSLDELQSVAIR